MLSKKVLILFGIALALIIGGTVVYLVFQQQVISRELKQLTQSTERGASSSTIEIPARVDQTLPPSDLVIYHEIGLTIEVLDGNSAKILWDQDVELTEIQVVESQMGKARGQTTFAIESEGIGLNSPYTLGDLPKGFKLLVGQQSTDFSGGKEYLINVVGIRKGETVRGLAYFLTIL